MRARASGLVGLIAAATRLAVIAIEAVQRLAERLSERGRTWYGLRSGQALVGR